MNRIIRRVATTLVASMLLGTVALSGCKKVDETKDPVLVEEDSVWYSTEKIDISEIYYADGKNYSSAQFCYIGMADDNFCCLVQSEEVVPNDFDWENDNYLDYYHQDILCVNSNGGIVNRISLADAVDSSCEYMENLDLIDGMIEIGVIRYDDTNVDAHGNTNRELNFYEFKINPVTGEISDRVPVEKEMSTSASEYYDDTFKVNGYMITTTAITDHNANKSSYTLEVTDAAGKKTNINLGQYFPDENIHDIKIFDYKDNSAMIMAYCDQHKPKFWVLNYSDMTVKDTSPEGTDWLDKVNDTMVFLNGHALYAEYGYINELDFDKHEVKQVFDFNDSNVNRCDVKDCMLVDYSDTSILFACKTFTGSFVGSHTNYYLYKLTKNDTNPNAGKTIIELGCLSEVNRPVADAVCKYNETNSEYFIRYDDTYNVDVTVDLDYDISAEVADATYTAAKDKLSYQLSIDLLAGEGPDIIIDGYGYSQLNNADYLIDLTSYVSKLDSSAYFSNIIDGSKSSGALYQLPLSFTLNGIFTSPKNVGEYKVGFTYDEYLDFVDKVCNGQEPIHLPRAQYFRECVGAMSDSFVKDGKVNFDNSEFRAVAEYIKNKPFNKINEDGYYPNEPAYYIPLNGFNNYLTEFHTRNGDPYNPNEYDFTDALLFGMPTSDGRGPSAYIKNSVGISAQASSPDACWTFVELLLADEVQDYIAVNEGFPVNRESYVRTANDLVSQYNRIINGEGNYSVSGHMMFGGGEIDPTTVQKFQTNCIDVAHISTIDPSISIILSEEIQPYLEDQKSLDEIIDILQNRVDTVVEERG
ncbi:MAG: extracellular solute-binding protein [Saccharofermentans sp.]|nr:extracellular solute-binding protein [Saccharofermentans sp.]